MAKASTLSGKKLLIMVGDGAAPEIFGEPCGLITKGITFAASSTAVTVPDCTDPAATPAWVEREVKDLSAKVTGDGLLAKESFATWNAWFLSGAAKNCRIKLDDDALGYYAGAYLLTGFDITGTLGDKMKLKVTLDSDGPSSFVANT